MQLPRKLKRALFFYYSTSKHTLMSYKYNIQKINFLQNHFISYKYKITFFELQCNQITIYLYRVFPNYLHASEFDNLYEVINTAAYMCHNQQTFIV